MREVWGVGVRCQVMGVGGLEIEVSLCKGRK